ncbi:MAG: DUF1554 domain-containing protein, partial [Leptospiraceae bacterium]|nr:DUF1554 domain-containing protein [Leptospiraceae bacterium]
IPLTQSDSSTTSSTTTTNSTLLSNLVISSVTLYPNFSSSTISYNTTVSSSISSVIVTPTASDTSATITVNGETVSSGSASSSISLSSGANTVTVIISGTDTTTYTITINRLAANKYRVFVTSASYNGNLGGVSGADSKCASDSNKPNDGSTYKAVIVNVTNDRRACSTANCGGGSSENTDWALKANKDYFRATDGTQIFTTTNSGIFSFGTLLAGWDSGTQKKIWTALNTDWTTAGGSCFTWGSTSSALSTQYGVSDSTGTASIFSGSTSCNESLYLLCGEQ